MLTEAKDRLVRAFLLSQHTLPNPNELSLDLMMQSPIQICFSYNPPLKSSVEVILKHLSRQTRSFFTRDIILSCMSEVMSGEKIENFALYLEDLEDIQEEDLKNKYVKLGWHLCEGENNLEKHIDSEEMQVRLIDFDSYH